MIIKSIKISNFLSYDAAEFVFSEGATIILGQNNTGKSKLFDAYNWVLYDEAYQTAAEDWEGTNIWKDELVNRYAKLNCEVGKRVEVSVSLTFEDEHKNNYLVLREYRILKLENEEWSSPSSSDITVTKRDAETFNSENYYAKEADDLLNGFFPKALSRYFLFQGEGISRLLRLNQRSHFTKAIGELSGLKRFDKARKYADKVYLKAKILFENEAENDVEMQRQKLELKAQIDESTEGVGDLKFKLDNEYAEKAIKEQKLEEKEQILSRFSECAILLSEIKVLEKQRDEKVEQRLAFFQFNRVNLFSYWIYKKAEPLVENFLRLYREAKENEKIPEPIRQDFIIEMLQDGICKVCGTSAPEGSEQHQHIASYLNDRALDKEVAVINALSDTASTLKANITQIPQQLDIFRDELNEIEVELDRIRAKISSKEEELRIVSERIADKLKVEKIERSDIEKINLPQLTRDRDIIKSDLIASQIKIDQLIGRHDEAIKNLKKFEDDFKKLMERSGNHIESERLKFAEKIKFEVDKLYDNFLNNLILNIEEEANSYFERMTKGNPALSGRIRVDLAREEVYTVDESGRMMTNINQANKVSLQISFVAAVLTVSNRIWDKHFPFVADAPISALGGNNKINAIKTIIEVFRQSIVIVKDDADHDRPETIENEQVRQLIRVNSKIHNAYELKMIGSTIAEQRTKINKIK